MTVRFQLLGAVEAYLDERPLDTGHARQRAVLAALLVDAGRPVAADQLIDRVWADRPPHRARNALSAYVSRLRGLLTEADGVRITRGPAGYLLAADPLTVDLHLFRHLVSRARAAARPADAAALLDQALALWRGEPFPTVDVPWFADLRSALEAERFAAELDRNDAALAGGRHAELLGPIAGAAAAHPLDERLAGQLMLAQYRCGRQPEALATYRRIRHRLVEEVGTEPGPQLRAVHQRILDADPGAPAPGRGAGRPRGNLERRPTRFLGRDEDVRVLGDAVRDAPLITLTGVGGVGKTRLAVETARRVAARFPDGVWMCELAPLSDGAAVGHAVAAALGVHQQQGLDIEHTVADYLEGRALLLVVDNCEHVLDAAARVVDRIVRRCPAVVVLATSRQPLGVDGERVHPVRPLPAPEAAALFADRASAHRPGFTLDAEAADAVGEICRRLDGLPLAIELAAARIRAMSAVELAHRLDASRLRHTARGADPRHHSLVAAIDWSYRLLSEPERALFTRLSLFAGGFDLAAAHGACAEPYHTEDDTLDLLVGLVDKSMVIARDGPQRSRYLVLETLRGYGRERLDRAGLTDRFAQRHAAHFTALAAHGAREVQGPHERIWVERVLPDFDNLRAAFERAVADRDADLALRLVTALPELAHLRVGYESASWAERALDLADPDHPLFPAAVGASARGAWNRGDFARARALAARARGRVPLRGTGRVAYPADVLADVALYEGDAASALRHYRAEVARARRDDDPIRLVWTLYYVAVCHAVLRTPEAGLPAAEEAVRVAGRTANPTAGSMARYALGLVLKKSAPDRALALFDEAGRLAASVRNFWWHGIALMESAATRAVHSSARRACRDCIGVLDHWERVGDWSQQWIALRYVVRLLIRVGAVADAVALHAALVAAGRPSPLDAAHLARLARDLGAERYAAAEAAGLRLGRSAVVGHARSALARAA
ncbi:MAG TPA: BTAD domain-containing putative transcriptional regulator [Pseudonocardia sp.]|jgi:predicted ATPase/DNA-binding SARP family transcriptional activator|uniref:AfsR/SARP family transcriptional regulator n=1 Tax=Pseudonocardia sp. TaxID=60912 RepID=UPI002B4AFFFE|nr:BTAD domain-containing putative transcriptional regulator [Pseudonocardia sp.]HLU57702.1 BTAD domain-containing putative transcriptional regulator [Pseudonocardia sp.]